MTPSCDGKQCCQSEVQLVYQEKPFFIFWMLKACVFCEAATRRVTPNGAISCLSQSRPYFMDGRQKECIPDPHSYSRQFRPPSADSAGTGWNLICGCSIAWLLFLPKCFLATQVGISSQNRQQICTTQTLAMDGRRDEIGRFLKTP